MSINSFDELHTDFFFGLSLLLFSHFIFSSKQIYRKNCVKLTLFLFILNPLPYIPTGCISSLEIYSMPINARRDYTCSLQTVLKIELSFQLYIIKIFIKIDVVGKLYKIYSYRHYQEQKIMPYNTNIIALVCNSDRVLFSWPKVQSWIFISDTGNCKNRQCAKCMNT